MAKKKTTIITSETREVFVIRRPVSKRRVWCAGCSSEVDMLEPEDVAALVGVRTRTIYAWLEAGHLDHTETAEGNLLVCPKCLWRRRAL